MTTEATAFDTNNPKGHVHLDEGDGQWRNRFFDSEQRRQEAEAIVDRLPKTADGVHVIPHRDYVCDASGARIFLDDLEYWEDDDEWYVYHFEKHVSELYSTRAAAEAALAEREREGGGDA